MADDLTTIIKLIGMPIWLFVIIILWSMVWKFLALWKSARKGSVIWFVGLAIFNTAGILPILYIFVFSKMKSLEFKPKKSSKKKISKKKKK
jgi:hypothetical protein